jgi:hypothetical protein
MNPQSVNDLTIGITQEKLMNIWLWEKLQPKHQLWIFKDHVYLGETAADYIQLIEKILTDDSEKDSKDELLLLKVILGKTM